MRKLFLACFATLALLSVACGGGRSIDSNFQDDRSAASAPGEEVIYLANYPDANGAEILSVSLDDGAMTGTMTHHGWLPGFTGAHIALTADGSTIYAIDAASDRLGAYDVDTSTFSIIGSTVRNAPTCAFSPTGQLFSASGYNHTLNLIDTSNGNVLWSEAMFSDAGRIYVGGADIVFNDEPDLSGDYTLYVLTNNTAGGGRGLYSLPIDLSGALPVLGAGTKVWSYTSGYNFTGLAKRYDGSGELIASSTLNDTFVLFDPDNGYSTTEYDMDQFSHGFGDMTSLPAQICPPYEAELLLGQDYPVGTVTVWTEDGELFVEYSIDDENWCLTETHMHVGYGVEDIPQTRKGNPIPGQFDFSGSHDCDSIVTYGDDEWITPENMCDAESIVIAAHAAFRSVDPIGYDDEGNPIYAWESAWADGSDFSGNNWATFIEWEVCCD